MNISIYIIFFISGFAGVVLGARFKNKWILVSSLAAVSMSAILIIATLMVNGSV